MSQLGVFKDKNIHKAIFLHKIAIFIFLSWNTPSCDNFIEWFYDAEYFRLSCP